MSCCHTHIHAPYIHHPSIQEVCFYNANYLISLLGINKVLSHIILFSLRGTIQTGSTGLCNTMTDRSLVISLEYCILTCHCLYRFLNCWALDQFTSNHMLLVMFKGVVQLFFPICAFLVKDDYIVLSRFCAVEHQHKP